MARIHGRSNRKPTGGKYKDYRKKKLNEIASEPVLTKLEDRKLISNRVLGGKFKSRLLRTKTANIYDKKSKKYVKAAIKTILENPANLHYVRRNIMTKGTIIDTDIGKAKVTSRPGQDGTVNAVLI